MLTISCTQAVIDSHRQAALQTWNICGWSACASRCHGLTAGWSQFGELQSLSLGACSLTGTLPESLATAPTSLQSLQIYDTALTGTLPQGTPASWGSALLKAAANIENKCLPGPSGPVALALQLWWLLSTTDQPLLIPVLCSSSMVGRWQLPLLAAAGNRGQPPAEWFVAVMDKL